MENPNFKNIKEFLLRHQFVVIGVICVVFFYIIYSWDVSSEDKRLTVAIQQEQDLKQQFQSLEDLQVSINSDVSQLPRLQTTFNEWKAKLVNPADLPDLLNEILKTGTANNLQFLLFTPGSEIRAGDYVKEPIKVVVSGNFNDIANFISQLANMDKIVSIQDFVISKTNLTKDKVNTPTSIDSHLSAELNLEVYHAANK